ncbi:CoA transferase [Dactylosporangium sp. NPDC005572]|uniref:CaiB/BaiF CoA transferase family protein n=1 Tax=Dactylosporangium sp. NPDC005572 TaxID=3156889 RepID=UPI0033A6C33C
MATVLSGERVLDYCWVGAGALVTQTLALYGAQVIKIESRARPDNLRLSPPAKPGQTGLDVSGYFASRNSGKKSFALNMAHPAARDIAAALARASTIVTSNFRPGVMDRWGLGYADVAAANPAVIYLSMPMQGNDGPHRDYVGFGSTIAAAAGLVHPSGLPGRAPLGTGTHYPDHVPNPGHALVALLSAVYRRVRTGRGAQIELSQFESTVNLVGPALLAGSAGAPPPAPAGNRVPGAAPHGVFPCREPDTWCAIAVGTDAQWAALCTALGRADLLADARLGTLLGRKAHEDRLEEEIAASSRTVEAWALMRRLQDAGVPAAVVATAQDVLADEHLRKRGYWVQQDHPAMGAMTVAGLPFRSDVDEAGPTPAPLLGADTWEIAESVLGMHRAEYERLVAAGVLT